VLTDHITTGQCWQLIIGTELEMVEPANKH